MNPQADRQRIVEFLAQETLLGNVRAPVLEKLAALGRILRIPKGNNLYNMGQPCHELHFLMEGQARVRLLAEDGRERLLHLVLPGDMLGAVPFFDGNPYPCTATSDAACEFLAFRRDEFLGFLVGEGDVILSILGGLVSRQRSVVSLLEEMTFKDAGARLFHYLVERSPEPENVFPRHVDPLPTREAIARAIGTVREVVSRRLSKFIESGHIVIDGRKLTILGPQ